MILSLRKIAGVEIVALRVGVWGFPAPLTRPISSTFFRTQHCGLGSTLRSRTQRKFLQCRLFFSYHPTQYYKFYYIRETDKLVKVKIFCLSSPDFKMLLHQIQRAESFEELKELCTSIELPPLELDEDLDICWKDFQFDAIAEGLLPADTKNTRYRALKTGADGNCLYRSASIFAFGDEGQHEEMRLRTLLELALNSRFYQEGEDIKEILLAEERQMHPNIGKSSAKLSDEQVKSNLS